MPTIKRSFQCALLLSGTVFASEFFVSPDGNDKNPGSEKAPFATIAKAAAAAGPGDTVKIGPGVYREQITFTRSGKKGAPVTFAGTRGKNGEFLTVVEAPGTVLSKWVPAPEIGPRVWKTPLARRPTLVMMNGAMITFVNRRTMELPCRKELPKELNMELFASAFGPKCKRLAGLDIMKLPADIRVGTQLFRSRQELFWPVIGNVLSGWHKGFLYVRFADERKPEENRFTASYGHGFTVRASELVFRDLHMRGSRTQIWLRKGSSDVTIDNCLLMHGGYRIRIDEGVSRTVVKNCILTAGFVRSDLFKLRSREDMRGGLLYLIFKYMIGESSSDDTSVSDDGTGTKIFGNTVLRGLIGIRTAGTNVEVADNAVREMSSIGILTTEKAVGLFHHNLVMNCGIPLRIHHLRHVRAKREEYHFNNLFVQARHGGSQIFVHSESYRFADKENFEPSVGGKVPVYKKNPPNPVDAGKFFVYHNTFWGGDDEAPAFTVAYLNKRFRMVMPFFVFNNIHKDSPRIWTTTHEITGPNVLYILDGKTSSMKRLDPESLKLNRRLGEKESATLWNKNDLPGLPDVTLAKNSPALEAALDVSRPFTVRGKSYPALPGFKPGYFRGKAPAAGALQEGESARRFIEMHKKTEAAIRMLENSK